MDINTCLETTLDYHVIAYYSHLLPIFVTLAVSFFVLNKSRYSFLSIIFSSFTLFFCLWLLGDVITWTSSDYNLVTAVWAPLDYINIIFFLLGAYFFAVFVREKDIPNWWKFVGVFAILPAWWITFSNQSISIFWQPVCEAFNNDFLSSYKFIIEVIVIAFIMLYALFRGRKTSVLKRWQIAVVTLALLLFFGFFSTTEYIASQTGIYEINLYSLFVLPVFLLMIIYSVTNFEIFKVRLIGSQLFSYLLVIMVGSQFFFLQESTARMLTLITFFLSLFFGVLLVRSGKREEEARKNVEKIAKKLEMANSKLKELDKQKDELLSIVSHQLATPVSSIKWYTEMLMDGDLGKVSKEQKEHLSSMIGVAGNLSDLVSMILDVSRIQLGRMHIEKQELDLSSFFKEILEIIKPKADEKKIKFNINIPSKFPRANLDKRYTHMTIENLLSNAIKYTPSAGVVDLTIEIKENVLFCKVQDTGVGIPKEDQGQIFGKMFRATNVRNSVEGNGFGLYVAKGAIEAQGGKIWFKSSEGKGTTFFIELPLK